MKKILLTSDLHNTLVNSNEAFLEAYLLLINNDNEKPKIEQMIYQKESRKKITRMYNLNYDEVIENYHKLLKVDKKVIDFLNIIKEQFLSFIVISSGNDEKVKRDMDLVNKYIKVDKYYSKSTFDKKNDSHWQKLKEEYNVDNIIYFGNDIEEDNIKLDYVSVIYTSAYINNQKSLNILRRISND